MLDQFLAYLLRQGYASLTSQQYVQGARGYILFHGTRHPAELTGQEAQEYLEHLDQVQGAKNRDQAREALLLLYRGVLGRELALPKATRLLDQVHEIMRVGHYSRRTEDCYRQWIKRYILFHNKRHPAEMGSREIEEQGADSYLHAATRGSRKH